MQIIHHRPRHIKANPLLLSEQLLSMRTLLILMALPSVLGYATSAPSTKPNFLPLIARHQAPSETSLRAQKYDLGLGKNPPLTTDCKTEKQTLDVQTASQFWMANEPARTFPSPLREDFNPVSEQPLQQVSRKRKPIPRIIPKRQSQDVLSISKDRVMSRSQKSDARLDLNTPWVEMLIYQQMHPTCA